MNCCTGTKVRYHSGTVKVNGKWADVYDVYHAHDNSCDTMKTWDVKEMLPTDSQFARYLNNRWQ